MILFAIYLLFPCLCCLTEANSTRLPRMVFSDKDTSMKRVSLPEHHVPVRTVLEEEPDAVTMIGQNQLISVNFKDPEKTPVERTVLWKECINDTQKDCNYKITVVHKREGASPTFVCGTNGKETICCDMNLSEQSPMCVPSEKMGNIRESIRGFAIKEGESSVLVESAGSADLYMTSQQYVGIFKFGGNRVVPPNQPKEQHYVGLVLSRRPEDPLQDRIYGFYKEKNRDPGLYSEMWLPYVTQVCTADIGGPKHTLQSTWTSQMNARLFCGDSESKQHFSELVDVATVNAKRWQDTKVYALFRNEWGMSAVCVYTIQDIDNIFQTSPFEGDQNDRPRACVSDSTKIHVETLVKIEKTSEMQQAVRPVDHSGPLLFNHHSYTHIYVHSSQHPRKHPVLFLSLKHGGIHKMIRNKSQTFVIAEYLPFEHRTHVLGIMLHPSSKKLYVNSRSELVQLVVANCTQYGDSCQDCVLARDPYCGWDGNRCTSETSGTVQDVDRGNHTICLSLSKGRLAAQAFRYSSDRRADEDVATISVPHQAKHFLQCPVTSHHAQYTWHRPGNSTSCDSGEQQCLALIDSMGPEQEGTYRCVSEEMGYSKVLAQYQLQLGSRAAGRSSSPLVWVCLMAVLIKSLI